MTETEMAQEPDTLVDPEQHAVLKLDLTPMTDWYTWRLRWDNPETFPQERLGILHCAFDIFSRDPRDAGDRLCLFLALADGDPASGLVIHDHVDRQRAETARKLGDKAHSMLVYHYFKDATDSQDGELRWLSQLELPGVLEKTIWFFRCNQFGNVVNLTSSGPAHRAKTIRQFASGLWKLCWDYKDSKTDSKGRSRRLDAREQLFYNQLTASRAKVLHLALLLDEEDTLVNHPRYPLDDACKEFLLDVALKPRYHEGRQATPDSLEQAFFFGSTAARVLILDHIAELERDRHREIRLAERMARDNEARLATLRRGPQSDNLAAEIARQLDES